MFRLGVTSIFAAEILDVSTTLIILGAGGFEGNPLVRLLGNYWIIVKFMLPLILALICSSFKRSDLSAVQVRVVRSVLFVGFLMALMPVLNNFAVIASLTI